MSFVSWMGFFKVHKGQVKVQKGHSCMKKQVKVQKGHVGVRKCQVLFI